MKIILKILKFFFPIFIYSAFTFYFFGVKIWPHLTTYFIGNIDGDGFSHIWVMGLWQYVFAHAKELFITNQIWPHIGFDLAHGSTFVGLGFLNHYMQLDTQSPVLIYNFWMIMSPVLSAWCAFFLCYYLTKNYPASILGGYIYGFSPFYIAHMLGGHTELMVSFFAPLLALLFLAYFDKKIKWYFYIPLSAALIALSFSISAEMLIIFLLIGGLIWLFTFFARPDTQKKLLAVLPGLIAALLLGLLCVSQYLHYFFYQYTTEFAKNLVDNSISFSAFFIPTPLIAMGGHFFESVTTHFPQDLYECGYIGLPSIFLIFLTFKKRAENLYYSPILFGIIICLIFSMGPQFHLRDRPTFFLPWALFAHLPVLDFIIPARFSYAAYLLLGVLFATWLTARKNKNIILIAILVVAFFWPERHAMYFQQNQYSWSTKIVVPPLFQNDTYKKYISKNDSVFMIPVDEKIGTYQAITKNYFRLTVFFADSLPSAISQKKYKPLLDALGSNAKPNKLVNLKNFHSRLYEFVKKMNPDEIVIRQDWNILPIQKTFRQLNYAPVYHRNYIVYKVKK